MFKKLYISLKNSKPQLYFEFFLFEKSYAHFKFLKISFFVLQGRKN